MTTIVILAGGRGARIGGNKPLHPYGRTTLIEATLDRLKPQATDIAINAGGTGSALTASLEHLGLPLVFDEADSANLGPLSGILTALQYADTKGLRTIITAPCDMPNLPSDMVRRLIQAPRADVVYFTGTRDYPLCALWQVSLRQNLEAALKAARPQNGLPVMRFLMTQSVHKIRAEDDRAFANINSPSDAKAHHV